MRNLKPELQTQYEEVAKKLLSHGDPCAHCQVTVEDVLCAHYLLCDYFIEEGEPIAMVGPRDDALLVSAVSRQQTGYGGIYKWKPGVQQVASLFYGLIKNHPFHDGNKRTALLIALYHLEICKLLPTAKQRPFETLAVRTAANTLHKYAHPELREDTADGRVLFIAEWLRRNTRRTDKRTYRITYNQLQSILNQHGFGLEKPSHNHINVVRYDNVREGLFRRQRQKTVRLAQVGFPGYTKEVGAAALKTVRQACGLTHDKGYDSQVFFKDATPLAAIISRYSHTLARLKDR